MEIEREDYKGYIIKIIIDESPENPREAWDCFIGKMYCEHKRYNLGDKEINKEYSIDEIMELNKEGKIIILPLFLYDHSGITMNTRGFSCPWDSGQVGFIFCFKEDIKKEYNWKVITKKRKEKIEKILINEVKIYDRFLTGEIYGFQIEDKEGEIIDSCYGFFDETDYVLKEAKSIIDYIEAKKPKQGLLFPEKV